MKYCVGFQLYENGEEPFSEIVKAYKDHISEVFFPWQDIATGRSAIATRHGFTDWTAQSRLEEELRKIEDIPKPAPIEVVSKPAAPVIEPVEPVVPVAGKIVQEIQTVSVSEVKEETEEPVIHEEAPVIEKEDTSGFKYLNADSFEAKTPPAAENVQPAVEPKREELPEIKVIGEAFGLYIIVETEGKLVMIDKHAAHERIIFERLKSRNCRQYSQKLLVGI